MAKKTTPARRARMRRDPAIFRPPPRVKGDRQSSIRNLHLRVRGRTYPIGENIEGETPWSYGMDQTGTVTLPVRDPSDWIMRVIDDEDLLLNEGVFTTIDGVVYAVSGLDHDGEGLYTLTLEDETSWRLKRFTSYRSASRARTTRYGFILSFVEEASRKPFPRMRSFIPEVDDKQPIRKAVRR
jgi:hypothetical protein